MIRFATIGTNFVTGWMLEAARSCPELHYAAVYSRSAEKAREFASRYGAEAIHTDLDALAEDPGIDAVYIASPNCMHFGQAARMLAHGKHVLCEKTITSNRHELARLLEIAAIQLFFALAVYMLFSANGTAVARTLFALPLSLIFSYHFKNCSGVRSAKAELLLACILSLIAIAEKFTELF